jgi:hypothetical protein
VNNDETQIVLAPALAQQIKQDLATQVTMAPTARQAKNTALCLAMEIEVVNSPATQERAVEAQSALRGLISQVEKSRTEVKKPVLDLGKKIDAAAKDFIEKVKAEELRIAGLIGDFQAAELAKAQSANALRNSELTQLEQAREAELATATTLEDRERIHAEYTDAIANLPPEVAPARAEGQRVTPDWEFEVTDPHLLARMHPHLVTIEPKRREIKEALKAGTKILGIKATPVVKASAKATKAPKPIDVEVVT